MIRHDRELLADLGRFNQHTPDAVIELMNQQDGGELPAAGLRAMGEQLRDLGDRFLTAAAERESRIVIDSP